MKSHILTILTIFTFFSLFVIIKPVYAQSLQPAWASESVKKLERELITNYTEEQKIRFKRGVAQVLNLWRAEDGDASAFENFIKMNFTIDKKTLDSMFSRFQYILEQTDGYMNLITLALNRQVDLDLGQIYPFDETFAAYNPSAHLMDDFFKNKLAFIALLNFPLTTLEERLSMGKQWTKQQWAETKLAQRFATRVPADVEMELSEATSEASNYIAQYNIWMHHLLDKEGNRLFPPKLRLLSHWNLRDELKAQYANKDAGFKRQLMIQKVMERIVTQQIPAVVVNSPYVDWNPFTNEVSSSSVSDCDQPPPSDLKISNQFEPDTRYAILSKIFQASRKVDQFSPNAPTLIVRKFNNERQMPEQRVRQMFEQILSSPNADKISKLIKSRLGRSLEPFDIWYNGFKPPCKYSEQQLDEIVSKKYPAAGAFQRDIPGILRKLGFPLERADYIASNIVVDPARGSGHAWHPGMRGAKAHLRTRVGKDGMNYKGYNIAVHELGHNVEQVLSQNDAGYTMLSSIPNTAFTEAMAFLFQDNDLMLLGLSASDKKNKAMETLDYFWQAYEIAGVSLVDMDVWHWMYDHPKATPSEIKEAAITIARNIWNKYYAPVFKQKDVVLLGIYSHMIHSLLYLPDYTIGHMIAFQIKEHTEKTGPIGPEFERMAKIGSIAPDLWMNIATGSDVGPQALLSATESVLSELKNN